MRRPAPNRRGGYSDGHTGRAAGSIGHNVTFRQGRTPPLLTCAPPSGIKPNCTDGETGEDPVSYDNAEDDTENAMSLAAIEAKLKPAVLATIDKIADRYKRLRRLQDRASVTSRTARQTDDREAGVCRSAFSASPN